MKINSCWKILGILLFLFLSCSWAITASSVKADSQNLCRCQPNESCWPTAADWSSLEKQLSERLIKPVSAIEPCEKDAKSAACATVLKNIHNPYFIEASPGNAQSQGWLGAWKYRNSVYAVEAKNTADVVAAVNFAREHHLRLVIKGTGHDYLGRSNAPNSLLIWTHNMRQVKFDQFFVPAGCPVNVKSVPAVTVSAGTRWLEVYDEVTTKHGRYVQGGGCATVGAAGGFIQGGGFGSFSKKYGVAAAGILQAEMVTADGKTLTANRCQNQDLFWAIRGGGAGTFGVVTQLTLRTQELPLHTGIFQGTITAKTDQAFKNLLQQFITFYRDNLNNEHWGEQITFTSKNSINIFMVFQGQSKDVVEKTWEPLMVWLKQHPDLFTIDTKLWNIPPHKLWDMRYWEKTHPGMITPNSEKGWPLGQYWWAANSKEVYNYWYTYQSWWLPLTLFDKDKADKLAEILFKTSRTGSVSLHINKGLAGASTEAVEWSRETAMNPAVYDAAALVIMAAGSNQVYPRVKGHKPDKKQAQAIVQKINAAMKLFREAAPDAGTYVNEADYFLKDWQQAFWGENYAKLLAIKQKYDPQGLFYCHHCIGSELWSDDGMCRISQK